MKRELKFRAWDKEQKKMCTDFVLAPTSPSWGAFIIHGSISTKSGKEINRLINNFYAKKGDILGGDYTLTDWSDYYGLNNLDIMQFTELKDKNGKEIYEGDIVQCQPDVPFYRVVVFEDGYYYFIGIRTYLGKKGKEIPFEIGVIKTSHPDTIVIGNIYENPEILK